MKIFNLTGRPATDLQMQDGVCDVDSRSENIIRQQLSFSKKPNASAIHDRVEILVDIARECDADCVLIEGPPYLVVPLSMRLTDEGIHPMFAYEEAVEADVVHPGGGDFTVNHTVPVYRGMVSAL